MPAVLYSTDVAFQQRFSSVSARALTFQTRLETKRFVSNETFSATMRNKLFKTSQQR
jgi:hypothetical protein